ncbi:unnamed protein product [Alopecurus aequalis]
MPSYLPHELVVSEILVRLPVKTLLRFRCACKAWRDTISDDTSFSQAHVRRHQQQKGRPSSLLIAPYIKIVDPDGENLDSTDTPGLYHWEENQRQDGVTTLVHDMAWLPVEDFWQTRHGFAHCDGLVMLPDAEGTVRVLNPATRRSLTLPWSPNSTGSWRPLFEGENTFGFGRDPSSGSYKIARFFHHDPQTDSFGEEVFTVGEDSCWRETAAKPPYPFIEGRTATFLKGSLIWTVHLKSRIYHVAGVPGFVRFSLEDESFRVMAAPRWYHGHNYEESRLAELHGELALARLNEELVEIWMCDDVDDGSPPRWARRHVLKFPSRIHPIAVFDDGVVFRDKSCYLSRLTSEGPKHMVGMKTLKYCNPDTDTLVESSSVIFDDFDVIPYIPTLVPI